MNIEIANNLLEVFDFLDKGYKPLAGATNILVNVKKDIEKSENFVDILGVKELHSLEFTEKGLYIGSTITFNELEEALKGKEEYNSLYQSAFSMGGPQIRNMATVGGNICDASPACDFGPPLLSLNAKVYAISNNGEREINIENFFLGNKKTALKENEIIKKIFVPKCNDKNGYIKVGLRNAMAISIVSLAYSKLNDKVSLAMGSVYSTPKKLINVENYINSNKKLSISQIIIELKKDISPITDLRASKEYRFEVSKNLLIDTLEKEFNYEFV
ncbi:MAG: FAD binding domain-containing protein [Firmicutes bacterium]|nr:FAD binding domain-containing protein [Candidatus Caballimonas caccae]